MIAHWYNQYNDINFMMAKDKFMAGETVKQLAHKLIYNQHPGQGKLTPSD